MVAAQAAIWRQSASAAEWRSLNVFLTTKWRSKLEWSWTLALDILLDYLVGQGIHNKPSYYSPLSLRLEGFAAGVPDDMMTLSEIASVDEIGGSDVAAVPEVNRFAAIQAMDADDKGRLLALLVARQINGGLSSGMRRDRRHRRFDQIAFASGVVMVAKWQAPVAFYDRLKSL